MPTISMTYDRVSWPSQEVDSEPEREHGFCEPGGWYWSSDSPEIEREIRECPELYWRPVSECSLREGITAAIDWGCSRDNGNGSFYSEDPITDYERGIDTFHAVHFAGFTDATLGRITRLITQGRLFAPRFEPDPFPDDRCKRCRAVCTPLCEVLRQRQIIQG